MQGLHAIYKMQHLCRWKISSGWWKARRPGSTGGRRPAHCLPSTCATSRPSTVRTTGLVHLLLLGASASWSDCSNGLAWPLAPFSAQRTCITC